MGPIYGNVVEVKVEVEFEVEARRIVNCDVIQEGYSVFSGIGKGSFILN